MVRKIPQFFARLLAGGFSIKPDLRDRHLRTVLALALLSLPLPAAQNPLARPTDAVEVRYARAQPVIGYTLRVDAADLSGYDVELRVRNARDTFRLGMAAHPEYDDRFWRFVEGPSVTTRSGPGVVTLEDSALWRVVAPGGEAVVHYRIHLPSPDQVSPAGWRPFLAPSGGLVGGPHSFMYVMGATLAPAYVALDLPAGWDVATGLEPTSDPRIFFAPTADVLVDCPILIGRLRNWRFAVDGVPHRVAYWLLPDATPFDTAALVAGLQGIVTQASAVFGRLPYREYTFLLRDGTFGSLEHLNSVTIGAASADLAQDMRAFLAEAAHEYFHTWNLMRIRPVEYRDVDYRPPPPSSGLWWSEGITMLYADLLRRRAGLPSFDSTRTAHLEGLIARYLGNPGNARFSPEQVSRVAYGAQPDALGDYSASVHLQGELLGTILDFIVRDATHDSRSLDDVIRLMMQRFGGGRGFTGADIEHTVTEVCGCAMRGFFDRYVRAANPIDFDRYLALAGLQARVMWRQVLDSAGHRAPDLAVRGWIRPGEQGLRLLLFSPKSVWGRAGLHTGDQVAAVNGAPIATAAAFRTWVGRLRLGDTVRITVDRPAGPFAVTVVVSGYERPVVTITERPDATDAQRALRRRWLAGTP
jgi:predicted metalloprotease with PDZ domain